MSPRKSFHVADKISCRQKLTHVGAKMISCRKMHFMSPKLFHVAKNIFHVAKNWISCRQNYFMSPRKSTFRMSTEIFFSQRYWGSNPDSVLVEKANFYKDAIRIFNPDWTSCPIWRSMWTPISKDNGYPWARHRAAPGGEDGPRCWWSTRRSVDHMYSSLCG